MLALLRYNYIAIFERKIKIMYVIKLRVSGQIGFLEIKCIKRKGDLEME